MRPLLRRYLAYSAALLLAAWLPADAHAAGDEPPEYDLCREATGEVNARIRACSRILDDLAESPGVLSQAARGRAQAHYLKGDYDQAIADYTVALQFTPASAALHIDRGLAYEEKPDYDRAIADYTQAIRIAPNEARAYSCRGRVYTAQRNYEPAVADFTQAIRAEPDWGLSYYLRGHAYEETGRRESAIADYRKALAVVRPYDAALVRAALARLGAAP